MLFVSHSVVNAILAHAYCATATDDALGVLGGTVSTNMDVQVTHFLPHSDPAVLESYFKSLDVTLVGQYFLSNGSLSPSLGQIEMQLAFQGNTPRGVALFCILEGRSHTITAFQALMKGAEVELKRTDWKMHTDNVSASPECLRQTVTIHRRLLNEAVGAAEWEERSGRSSKLAVKLGLVNFLQRFVAATATELALAIREETRRVERDNFYLKCDLAGLRVEAAAAALRHKESLSNRKRAAVDELTVVVDSEEEGPSFAPSTSPSKISDNAEHRNSLAISDLMHIDESISSVATSMKGGPSSLDQSPAPASSPRKRSRLKLASKPPVNSTPSSMPTPTISSALDPMPASPKHKRNQSGFVKLSERCADAATKRLEMAAKGGETSGAKSQLSVDSPKQVVSDIKETAKSSLSRFPQNSSAGATSTNVPSPQPPKPNRRKNSSPKKIPPADVIVLDDD